MVIPEQAIVAAHAAICEQNIDDCLDPDWRGKCVKAVEAAAPYMPSLTAGEIEAVGDMVKTARAHGVEAGQRLVMVDRLQAAVSAALALAHEWEAERANFEEMHDYSNYRLSVLNNAAQKLRDAIGSALRDSDAE